MTDALKGFVTSHGTETFRYWLDSLTGLLTQEARRMVTITELRTGMTEECSESPVCAASIHPSFHHPHSHSTTTPPRHHSRGRGRQQCENWPGPWHFSFSLTAIPLTRMWTAKAKWRLGLAPEGIQSSPLPTLQELKDLPIERKQAWHSPYFLDSGSKDKLQRPFCFVSNFKTRTRQTAAFVYSST